MIGKTPVGIAVGIAGFIGYCVYFDQKRRSDPDFKKKLRERRRAKREAQLAKSHIPHFNSLEERQKYFFQQAELGDTYFEARNFEEGIVHMVNAVVVCSQPQQLQMLQMLQSSIPAQIFNVLLQRLAVARQNYNQLTEEDVQ